MAKPKKQTPNDKMLNLIREYESVSAELNPLEKRKKEVWEELKILMGGDEERIVPGFGKVVYKHDKDKDIKEVDFEAFKTEQPKLYKRYVVEDVKKGARRLVLAGMEEE